ncbi:MAG: response regulator, partial [Bacteroidetes bacterium]
MDINAEQVHILVVEDSLTQAEQLRYALEQKGFCVTIQRDGEQALAWMQEHLPTLIISDIVMPRMNGYQLCKAVKDDPRLREIPFMLLTSLSDPADVIEGLKAGADNFVVKPFNEEFLLSRIKY